MGALAGYFGGVVDACVVWLHSTVASTPDIMLLIALVFTLDKVIVSVYIALGIISWKRSVV